MRVRRARPSSARRRVDIDVLSPSVSRLVDRPSSARLSMSTHSSRFAPSDRTTSSVSSTRRSRPSASNRRAVGGSVEVAQEPRGGDGDDRDQVLQREHGPVMGGSSSHDPDGLVADRTASIRDLASRWSADRRIVRRRAMRPRSLAIGQRIARASQRRRRADCEPACKPIAPHRTAQVTPMRRARTVGLGPHDGRPATPVAAAVIPGGDHMLKRIVMLPGPGGRARRVLGSGTTSTPGAETGSPVESGAPSSGSRERDAERVRLAVVIGPHTTRPTPGPPWDPASCCSGASGPAATGRARRA